MALPPLTAARWFTAWSLHLPSLLVAVLMALGYLYAVRRHETWPVSRTLWFVVAGTGSLVVVTQSFLGTYAHTLFWPLAVQDVLLLTLVPVGLTLGRPLDLLGVRLPRVLTFPLVGSVAAVAVLTSIYVTGWDAARLDSAAFFAVTQLVLVALGCAFLWPLLGVDEGTGHTSYGVRTVIGFLDGLLDAIPGLAILGTGHVIAAGHYAQSSLHDQQLGGTAMVGLSELVGLPALLVLLVQWVRTDAKEAAQVDAELDVVDAAEQAAAPQEIPQATGKPWWEVDPGPLSDRFPR